MKSKCMFALPRELTGTSTMCGLTSGTMDCNRDEENCCGFIPHTEETLELLNKAINERNKNQKNGIKECEVKNEQ